MRIIAGPCLHESLEQSLEIATECKRVCDKFDIEYYFKASFTKANRTHITSARGSRFYGAVLDFQKMKKALPGLKIVTDVHETTNVIDLERAMPDVVDVYQIPAFLSRQTDLIKIAAQTGKIVNIKKGQFMPPWDVHGAVRKADVAKEVWVTERGSSFGYDNLVVDFTSLEYLADHAEFETFFDATHSVQKLNNEVLTTLKNYPREYAPGLLRAASALGTQNFFMEVHKDPDHAPCDGPNMLKLDSFDEIINDIVRFNYT